MVTKVKIKYKNLMKLGIKKGKAWEWANSTKAYWLIAKSPILSRVEESIQGDIRPCVGPK